MKIKIKEETANIMLISFAIGFLIGCLLRKIFVYL